MLDGPVHEWLAQHRAPWLTVVLQVLTYTGGNAAVVLGTVVLAALLWRRGRARAALCACGATATGIVLLNLLKVAFKRERPTGQIVWVELHTYSFPSGHALLSTLLAVLWAALWARRAWWPLLALYPLLIGASRVYLGVHWPSDVLAGWVVGAAVAAAWCLVAGRAPLRR